MFALLLTSRAWKFVILPVSIAKAATWISKCRICIYGTPRRVFQWNNSIECGNSWLSTCWCVCVGYDTVWSDYAHAAINQNMLEAPHQATFSSILLEVLFGSKHSGLDRAFSFFFFFFFLRMVFFGTGCFGTNQNLYRIPHSSEI